MNIGTRIDESGTLLRVEGGFALRRDVGGRWRLDLRRTPVDHVEKRVRITGVIVGEDLVEVDGVAPEVIAAPTGSDELADRLGSPRREPSLPVS